MYGVGYPVMDKAISGQTVLWLLVVLMVGKVLATSLTLSIGGSGGIFAPSLFTGAMGGMAFGVIVQHLFGPIVSSPAIFGVVAMGAVFGAAAQAPLTAIASVVEMTGNFTLILPVMLAVGIATALSKRLSYGSIYTAEAPSPWHRHRATEADERPADAHGLRRHDGAPRKRRTRGLRLASRRCPRPSASSVEALANVAGPVTETREPQAIFSDETLDQALRQLVLYGRAGLPVLSPDGQHLRGWVTRHNVLRVLAERVGSSAREAERGRLAAEFSEKDAASRLHVPRTPLEGYEIVEVTIGPGSPALGRRIGEVPWPPGSIVVAASENRELVSPRSDIELHAGERVILLAPTGGSAVADAPETANVQEP